MDCKVWLLKSRKRKVFSQERHGSFAFACSGSARWAVAAVEPSCTRAALSNSCVSCSLGFDRVQCRRLSKGQPASTPGQLLPPRRMACERKCDRDREGRSGNHLELRAHAPSADIERLKGVTHAWQTDQTCRTAKAIPRPEIVTTSCDDQRLQRSKYQATQTRSHDQCAWCGAAFEERIPGDLYHFQCCVSFGLES